MTLLLRASLFALCVCFRPPPFFLRRTRCIAQAPAGDGRDPPGARSFVLLLSLRPGASLRGHGGQTRAGSDYATQAVEQYKLALDADPNSRLLQDGLADLYFKIGRIREAVAAAQDQVGKNPDDIEAHTLLGKVYLRSLGDMQSAAVRPDAAAGHRGVREVRPAEAKRYGDPPSAGSALRPEP